MPQKKMVVGKLTFLTFLTLHYCLLHFIILTLHYFFATHWSYIPLLSFTIYCSIIAIFFFAIHCSYIALLSFLFFVKSKELTLTFHCSYIALLSFTIYFSILQYFFASHCSYIGLSHELEFPSERPVSVGQGRLRPDDEQREDGQCDEDKSYSNHFFICLFVCLFVCLLVCLYVCFFACFSVSLVLMKNSKLG